MKRKKKTISQPRHKRIMRTIFLKHAKFISLKRGHAAYKECDEVEKQTKKEGET